MPQMKKMASPPPEPPKKRHSGTLGKTVGFKSQIKKDPAERKRPITSDVYGDELLKPARKREKEIAIAFYPFTQNNLRLSTDGRFIIERFSVEESEVAENGEILLFPASHWNLYYYKEPIADFTPPESENDFKNIIYNLDEDCDKFLDFDSATELANKIIELVRDEYLLARQQKMEELKEQERLEREKKDAESDSESENAGEEQEKKEESEILPEVVEEKAKENLQKVEGT